MQYDDTSKEVRKNEARDVANGTRELTPPVDIYDTEAAVVVVADIPGVAPDRLEVNVDRGTLTIRGRREAGGKGTPWLREYHDGDYVRSFALGDDLDVAKISATVKNGVLELRLPKSVDQQPRKIAVKAG